MRKILWYKFVDDRQHMLLITLLFAPPRRHSFNEIETRDWTLDLGHNYIKRKIF